MANVLACLARGCWVHRNESLSHHRGRTCPSRTSRSVYLCSVAGAVVKACPTISDQQWSNRAGGASDRDEAPAGGIGGKQLENRKTIIVAPSREVRLYQVSLIKTRGPTGAIRWT